MPDYSKSIIYKLCCNDTNITDIYIGSTSNFSRRKTQHKQDCKYSTRKGHNFKVYKFIRENGGWENWSMIMLHEFSCDNKLQRDKKEREFIENLKPTLNKNIPTRTSKEWRGVNKEQLKRKRKIYDENNRNYINKYAREYYQQNKKNFNEKIKCECGSILCKQGIAKHKKTKKHLNYLENNNI